MSYGVYKSGQGYWVRVMTAVMAGLLILGASAWAWDQLENLSEALPKPSARLNLQVPVEGGAASAPGQAVTLLGDLDERGVPMPIATAVLKKVEAAGNAPWVMIEKISYTGARDLISVKSVAPAAGGAALSARLAGVPQPEHMVNPTYLQGAGVGLVMLLGSAITWWFVGARPRTVDFLIATDGEMKKVNWSTRKDVMASTWVVVMWSVLLATGLYMIDLSFASFFKLINLLK
jgi:preprotein translocase SecE subunit